MKLSPQLERQVKEEIWEKIVDRLDRGDTDFQSKQIRIVGTTVTLEFFIDLDREEE